MTESIDLQNLPYPMFELSKAEIEALKKAHRLIQSEASGMRYLCTVLQLWVGNPSLLVGKIQKSLNGDFTLNGYLNEEVQTETNFHEVGHYINFQLRLIWIEKLLAQTGDTI